MARVRICRFYLRNHHMRGKKRISFDIWTLIVFNLVRIYKSKPYSQVKNTGLVCKSSLPDRIWQA